MKKIYLIIFGLWLFLLFICGAKDPYDSFGRLTGIGLVVSNTASLSAHEDKIRDKLEYGGCTITLIDSSSLDDSLYDGTSEWDDLNIVIICYGTYTDSTASPDTSIVHGIGDVDLICFEPSFWSDLGLPDSTGSISDDSIMVRDASFFPDSIWSVWDSLVVYSSDTTMYTLDGATGDSTNWYFVSIDTADTVVFYKDFGDAKRVAWGIWDASDYLFDDDEGGFTFLNRMVAYMYGNNADSIFDIAVVPYSSENASPLNYLQLNGHTTDTINTTSPDFDPDTLDNYDLIWWQYSSAATNAQRDTLIQSGKPLMWNYTTASAYGTVYSPNDDSVIIVGDNHQALSGYSNGANYQIYDDNSTIRSYYTIQEDSLFGLLGFGDSTPDTFIAMAKKNRKELHCGMLRFDYLNSTGFDLISQFAGWLMDDEPLQPDSVTITAISEDSMSISWGDQDGSATYGVRIYYPSTSWWTTSLAAGTTCDTILGMMPNYELQVDVAAISGTDTLYSLNDPDTAYSLAFEPASPFFEGLSDTSLTFTLNGHWLRDAFSDTNLATGTVWTEANGDFEVVERYWTMRSLNGTASGGAADTNVISTPYVCNGSFDEVLDSVYINKDVIWNMDFRFDDSLGLWDAVYFEYYFVADSLSLCPYPAYTYPDGYWMRIEPHYRDSSKGKIELHRMNQYGSDEVLKADSSWSDPSATDFLMGFKWNNLQIVRDWRGTPIDTTVRWSVVLNDDSLFHYSELTTDSMVFDQDGIIIATNAWGIYFDNIWIKSITPGSNHDSTHYALEDSANSVYVDWQPAPDTLAGASEVWGTYNEFGGSLDTLTSLDAFTTYYFRLKARNGRN
ncbi:MAG: fibronectin type III domain-containing protein [Candidatus Hodarchaeota archaeon]